MYSDPNHKYLLYDFQLSHNELLLRNFKNLSFDIVYNTDILFKGVTSLNIVTTYKGIEISAVEKVGGQTCSIKNSAQSYIFRLKDDSGTETYIEATAFGVFKNTLDSKISSLGDYSFDNECILWSHEDAEFKNKFKPK